MTTKTIGKYRIYELSGSDELTVKDYEKDFDDYSEALDFLDAMVQGDGKLNRSHFIITQPIWDHLGNYDRYPKE